MTGEKELKWKDLSQVPVNTNVFTGKEKKNRILQHFKYHEQWQKELCT